MQRAVDPQLPDYARELAIGGMQPRIIEGKGLLHAHTDITYISSKATES